MLEHVPCIFAALTSAEMGNPPGSCSSRGMETATKTFAVKDLHQGNDSDRACPYERPACRSWALTLNGAVVDRFDTEDAAQCERSYRNALEAKAASDVGGIVMKTSDLTADVMAMLEGMGQ